MLPIDLVLVRHGESEGNVARRFSEKGDDSLFTEEFMKRHSSRYRLTDRGRKQPVAAGKWIKENIGERFDRYEVSPYARAMETAALMDLPDADWRMNDYLRERDIADWDNVPESRKKAEYPASYAQYKLDPFRWQPPGGGESVAQMCMRSDRVLDTYHRQCRDQSVIVTCHGMLMWGFMIRIERLTPQEFLRRTQVAAFRIRNCQILHYTRRNPVTGQVSDHADWVRSVCPWDIEGSDLNWRRIIRPRFSNQDLLRLVDESPRFVS
jgi:broad specificity phosphatase PhoE